MARPPMPSSPATPGEKPASGEPGGATVLAWIAARPVGAAALFYALLSLALFAEALVPGNTLSGADYLYSAAPWAADRPAAVPFLGSNFEVIDAVVQFDPWLQYTRERLPDVPLWNDQVAVGRPYLANAQSAILSPFRVPGYVLPLWWSLGFMAALKVFAASFGTFLLGRQLGMRFGGALLAGLAFGFSLFFVAWIAWPQSSVFALLPWLLLLTERVLTAPGPLSVAGLASIVALQFFGGHPESNFHLLATTVVWFGFRAALLRRDGGLPSIRGPTLGFVAAMAGGAALAALTLLPFLELLSRSNDVNVREGFADIKLPREYLLGSLLSDYWGRTTQVAFGAVAQQRALYIGALPLLLAVAALVLRPTLTRAGVAILGALTMAIVLGVPPFPEIAGEIPIVKTGNHIRLVIVVMLCLALLAGWGLDDLTRRDVARRNLVLGAAGALLVAPVVVLAARGELSAALLGDALKMAWGFSWPAPPAGSEEITTIRMGSLIVWLTFMGLAAALVFLRLSGRLAATAFVALAVALVVTDLFKAGMGATPAIDTDVAKQPSTPGLRYLQARTPNRFVGLRRPLGPAPLIPNSGLTWGLADARSYDLPVEERYDKLWRRAILDGGPTDTPSTSAQLTAASLPAFRLMSVTDIAQDPDEPPVRTPSLPQSYDGRDLRVYRTPRPLPRAGVVDAQQVVRGEDAELAAVLRPGFDGRRTVVTDRPLPGLRSVPGEGRAGTARIVKREPERVVVEATALRSSELVLTDLHYPGWKVELDGRPADLHRVDYLLRGTTLPAGRHTVEFTYAPLSWRLGWVISLVALVALAITVAVGLRGRRPRAPEQSSP